MVLLSGGASGIGRATAHLVAREGATVAIGDVDLEGARAIAREIVDRGGRALAARCDVRSEESVAAFVSLAAAEFGGIDCVDHNAAWSHPRLDTDAGGVDLGVWERVLETNTRGALLMARHAIPRMTERGGGSIVNISSGTSTIGESTRIAYGVSKAAINQLDSAPGHSLRPGGHPGERHRAGIHPDRDVGGHCARGDTRPPGRVESDAPARTSRRHRPGGRVLVQRGILLRQWSGPPRRRWSPDRRDHVGRRVP